MYHKVCVRYMILRLVRSRVALRHVEHGPSDLMAGVPRKRGGRAS